MGRQVIAGRQVASKRKPKARTPAALSPRGTPAERPASFALPGGSRTFAAIALLGGLIATGYLLHAAGKPNHTLSAIFGAVFGIALQRSRFCFLCNFRDWLDRGDPRGLLGILVALAVGIAGYTLVFGAWLPDAGTGRLPPDAFIGPVSGALIIAGLTFGAGMAISGSCVSAHLYRLGEGSPTAPFALIGTVAGFILGFAVWNPVYLAFVSEAPVIWLPRYFGYAGALIVSLAVLALIAFLLVRTSRTPRASVAPDAWHAVFVQRWPAWIGGALVGVLGTVAYLRVAPLGVTAEIASRARSAGHVLGVLPERLNGLDTLRGCVGLVRDALLSINGVFVIALVVASFASALIAGQFKPALPNGSQIARGLSGGVLLGFGAMIGLGCTIGTLLSGIMAGALSGWVFGAAVFIGVVGTLKAGRRAGLLL